MSVGTTVVVIDELNHLGGFAEVGATDALQLGDGAADVESSRVEKCSNLAGEFQMLPRPYLLYTLYLVFLALILTAVSLVKTFDKFKFFLRFLTGEDAAVLVVTFSNLDKKSGGDSSRNIDFALLKPCKVCCPSYIPCFGQRQPE